jgi:hypothetical protein
LAKVSCRSLPLWLHHKIDQKNTDHKIGKKEKKIKENKEKPALIVNYVFH